MYWLTLQRAHSVGVQASSLASYQFCFLGWNSFTACPHIDSQVDRDVYWCGRCANAIPDPALSALLSRTTSLDRPLNKRSVLSLDVALDGLRENSICTFAVCSARYKTRPGLVYHYGHSHSTSSGDPAKELSPSPAEVEPRSVADTAASNQPGWSQNQLNFLTFL